MHVRRIRIFLGQLVLWCIAVFLVFLLLSILVLTLTRPARALNITFHRDDGTACVLKMGEAPGDALQMTGDQGDLQVAGTFAPGDPCYQDTGLPTGEVTIAPWVVPEADVPFDVYWSAEHATACRFVGSGWSGVACGPGSGVGNCDPAGSYGVRSVIHPEGVYEFGLTCSNATHSEVLVADPYIYVGP